jgi:hypothetical protein
MRWGKHVLSEAERAPAYLSIYKMPRSTTYAVPEELVTPHTKPASLRFCRVLSIPAAPAPPWMSRHPFRGTPKGSMQPGPSAGGFSAADCRWLALG